jgi:hypothetical protein
MVARAVVSAKHIHKSIKLHAVGTNEGFFRTINLKFHEKCSSGDGNGFLRGGGTHLIFNLRKIKLIY